MLDVALRPARTHHQFPNHEQGGVPVGRGGAGSDTIARYLSLSPGWTTHSIKTHPCTSQEGISA
jgi:hypothetical protein